MRAPISILISCVILMLAWSCAKTYEYPQQPSGSAYTGLLKQVKEIQPNGSIYLMQYNYDKTGRLKEAVSLFNEELHQSTVFEYDETGKLSNIIYDYGYQQNGNVIFTYETDVLVRSCKFDYNEDPIPNSCAVYELDETGKRLLTAIFANDEEHTFTYNPEGNMTFYSILTKEKTLYEYSCEYDTHNIPMSNIADGLFLPFESQHPVFRFTYEDILTPNNVILRTNIQNDNKETSDYEYYETGVLKGFPAKMVRRSAQNQTTEFEFLYY